MNEGVLLRKVGRTFNGQQALKGVSFGLPRRGLFAILGPSGCGKSTLLNILSGLDDGFEGDVWVLGKKMRRMGERKRRAFRLAHIGYVFQNFNLLEMETAEMNVMLTMDALYGDELEKKKQKANDLLTFFGVEKKSKQLVNTLSGGEKQRVALARALATDPEIVLADEPTGALDQKRAEEVFGLLQRIAKDRLVIVVSHDEALSRAYCDASLLLKNGELLDVVLQPQRKNAVAPKSLVLEQKRPKGRVSSLFWFTHALHILRAKPWRTLVSEAAIATGLTGLGLGVFISMSISSELTSAFSSLVPSGAVIMAPRSGGDSPIGSVYAAGFEECEYALEEYGDMVMDYGTDLHMDYESWFVDRNDFTFQSGVETVRLNDFSIRHINDFLWLDTLPSPLLYPRTPAILYTDQVVLGLPYENMFTVCLNLHIRRDYQSLGDHIDAKGMELVLHAANYEYGFDDEELFSVVAVTPSPRPCFYHLDHRWNRKVLLDQMRFRSSLSEETPNPQYIFEIPYLALSVPYSEFLYFARRDPKLAHLLYENANDSYLPTACSAQGCDVSRLYLYGADKTGVGFPFLDECMARHPEIIGRQPITSGSYYGQIGSLAMGFVGKFYLCRQLEGAERIVDAYSDLPSDQAFLPGESIPQTLDGSFFGVSSGGVRLRSYGKGDGAPQGVEECYLSEGLYQRWGSPNEIYVAAEVGAEEVGTNYVRTFRIAPLKVLGSRSETQDTFFVSDDWSVDFFIEALGMSSFLLEPSGAVLYLSDGADAVRVVKELNTSYADYSFSNPAQEIADSIATTFGYVGTMLTAFSLVTLAMSGLLFLIVMAITMSENAGEVGLLRALGISVADTVRSYHALCVCYASISLVSSVLMLGVSILFAKFFIAESFGSAFVFSLPWQPFLAVVLVALAFVLALMLGISANLRRRIAKK
ncbi:MAG: ATP-binding cassette domain-containing protein [Bacilli bacterium]|nr:ATP-binding cassette domain-containing protein [Bacilli bacterium]